MVNVKQIFNPLVVKFLLAYVLLSFGMWLNMVNVYGLTQNIRVENFSNQYLRFVDDQPLPFEETLNATKRVEGETDIEYATRMTDVVAKGVSHIEWLDYPVDRFHQLIPVWENYFLNFMGIVSGIPEFERYHFANYERSLQRGIGICGDASMIISQLLDEHKIENKILTFPGHVVVLAKFNNGLEYILDADFGVVVPYKPSELKENNSSIAQLYVDAGYTSYDFQFFQYMYQQQFGSWNGVQHFITKKYYFEKITYWLKWPLPICMVLLSLWCIRRLNFNKVKF